MKDNFSKQAGTYAKFRPHYPVELYEYLFNRVMNTGVAWDCGTGNGQVAIRLAERFSKVYGTDISQSQLDHARQAGNIEYRVAPAEDSSLPSRSVDLITVAQAIHWFDADRFFKEIKRVARTGCLVAYWAYYSPEITPGVNEVLTYIHDHVVGPYWDPEREIWRNKYKSIRFPLQNIEQEHFEYQVLWTYEHFEGYLNSWSAVQHCIAKTGTNPVSKYLEPLKLNWKEPKPVIFPIFLYAGVV